MKMKVLKRFIRLTVSLFVWPMDALWRGRKMEQGSSEEIFFVIGLLGLAPLALLATVGYLCKNPIILLLPAGLHFLGWLMYRSYLKYYLNLRRQSFPDEVIESMTNWEIWWDDVAKTKISRLWRLVSEHATRRKRTANKCVIDGERLKSELAKPENDLIGEIVKRYHISHARADEIFSREIKEIAEEVQARLNVATL